MHAPRPEVASTLRRATAVLIATVFAACTVEDPSLDPPAIPAFEQPPPELPDRGYRAERNVFWGDLHIHSSHSYDAYTMGVRAMPEDVYKFTRGDTIRHALGYPIRASRPLDFAAVTDHAEFLGMARALDETDGVEQESLESVVRTGNPLRITWNFFSQVAGDMATPERRRGRFQDADTAASLGAWQEIIDTAERFNEPGRFTTFIGYEWTSMPDEENLHRNVIYRGSKVPSFPFSSLDSENPEDLWRALELQREAGMEAFAIPHNGNVSNGRMYQASMYDGSAMDERYAKLRNRNEPISEILQVKGSSETHPVLSTDDEFAGFEIYDTLLSASGEDSKPKGSYARDALRTGLEMSDRHGFNPFRFGVIGSSDSHNASSSVEEDAYHGKLPMLDGSAGIRLGKTLLLPESVRRGATWSAAGLAAVWAEENTRASLFDAMRRRETYATSGPRITLRFFGGAELQESMLEAADLEKQAYAAGVPMGGELPPSRKAPRFLVTALKDPQGANLDRIQIIKGWVDEEGRSHEKIFDVAASDGRKPDPRTGRMPDVGNTVDVSSASYENTIGAAALTAFWEDPEFDPSREAFWYARVLEIPTPRWSTYDARVLGVEAPQPAWLRERAISSAIWAAPRD